MDRDCDFLEQERIMDYSLLVGLHFQETSYREPLTPEEHASGVATPPGYFLSSKNISTDFFFILYVTFLNR